MIHTEQQIQAAVANGLNRVEIEALLDRKFDEEEIQIYNKTKAYFKLKVKKEKEEEANRKKANSGEVANIMNPQLQPPISQRFTKDHIKATVQRTHGMTAAICKALDCTYQQWMVYLRRRQDVKVLQEECRKEMVVLAESKLLDNLNSDDLNISQRAAEYILRHQGVNQGWADQALFQQTLAVKDGSVNIAQIFGFDDKKTIEGNELTPDNKELTEDNDLSTQ